MRLRRSPPALVALAATLQRGVSSYSANRCSRALFCRIPHPGHAAFERPVAVSAQAPSPQFFMVEGGLRNAGRASRRAGVGVVSGAHALTSNVAG